MHAAAIKKDEEKEAKGAGQAPLSPRAAPATSQLMRSAFTLGDDGRMGFGRRGDWGRLADLDADSQADGVLVIQVADGSGDKKKGDKEEVYQDAWNFSGENATYSLSVRFKTDAEYVVDPAQVAITVDGEMAPQNGAGEDVVSGVLVSKRVDPVSQPMDAKKEGDANYDYTVGAKFLAIKNGRVELSVVTGRTSTPRGLA